MNKKILFLILLGAVLALPIIVFAASQACNTINAFTNITEALGAAIVIIGWIITGILYLTAAGAPDKLGTAKKALIACVIGTVAVIIATVAYGFVRDALALPTSTLLNCSNI